jgi:peptide/nickel transport system substrate-binding protein
MLKRARTLSRAALAATALACSVALGAPAWAQTLTAVMQSGLRVLDPIANSAAITTIHGYMIYDTLVGIDANHQPQPQMADWEVSEDGKVYTFTLREGLLWHDGEPVTAEDCVTSIRRWGEVDIMGQVIMDLVAAMNVLDERTFEIVLETPTEMLLPALGKIGTRSAFIMPKRIAETPGSEPTTEAVGSGPFRFVREEFDPGTRVVYERNDDYVPREEEPSWTAGGKVVNVDRVEWITMPDQLTAVNALLSGEVDYVEVLPYDLLGMLEGEDEVKVEVLGLGLWTYYRFNFLHPPFDDRQIRQAAMYATGQEDVLLALASDPKFFEKCVALFGCGTPYESDYGAEMLLEPQPEKAKQLLEEAGYDGTPVVILHPTDNPQVSSQPVVLAEMLRNAGFVVDLQSMDWQSVATRRTSRNPPDEGGWNIHTTTGPLVGITDPVRHQGVAASGDTAWFGWPDFPEIEELRAQFAVASDEEELKRLAEEIQRLAIDEGVVVPLGQFVIPTGYRTELSGVLESPTALFWNVEKTEN